MRKIIASLFITLDGVFEAPGEGDISLPEKSGWSMPYTSDEVVEVITAGMASSDAMLLGRITYEEFSAFWTNADPDDPFTQFMNNQTKYVASTTLKQTDWNNSHLIQGDLVTELNKLKQEDGKNISIVGSGALTCSLIEAELVDELQLLLCPVVLGVGKRLFEDANYTKTMTVLEVRAFASSMTYLRLQPQ